MDGYRKHLANETRTQLNFLFLIYRPHTYHQLEALLHAIHRLPLGNLLESNPSTYKVCRFRRALLGDVNNFQSPSNNQFLASFPNQNECGGAICQPPPISRSFQRKPNAHRVLFQYFLKLVPFAHHQPQNV